MTEQLIEKLLWVAGCACLAGAAAEWRHTAVPPAHMRSGPISEGADTLVETDAGRIAADNETVVTKDPFRATRRPSPVAFVPGVEGTAQAFVPPRPPRPQLAVSGIIGPPWEAVLEGVPARDGPVVVKTGDVFGELRVTRVKRDTVVVHGADTTWRLTVRRAW